jgi:hypothetical protein
MTVCYRNGTGLLTCLRCFKLAPLEGLSVKVMATLIWEARLYKHGNAKKEEKTT